MSLQLALVSPQKRRAGGHHARALRLMCASLIAIVLTLVLLSVASIKVLSAVRSYVAGEGLWSKAQKDATFFLTEYARSGSELDYQRYLVAIRVPKSDHIARIELSKPDGDIQIARQGFLDGRNSPEDVDGMVWLFVHFQSLSYMKQAIEIWTAGDENFANLEKLGSEVHRIVLAGALSSEEMDRIVNEIDRVNAELTPLEDRFSHTLGEAAREIQNLLDWSLALGGLILAAGGCWTCSILVQKIQQSECFSRHLRDTASDAIFVVDCASGQILESNRKAEELLGCPGYPFKGAPSSLFLPSSGSPSSGSASDGWPDYVSILTKGGLTREMGLLLPDGRTLPVEVSSNAARVGNRTVVQSIVRDVSARKQLEDSLRKAHDSALDSSRVKSEFLANMSHEIRTPMNGVLGMIGVLLDTDLTPDQRECAEVVHDSAQSLLRVINDILDFSKIEAGRLEVYPELFNWSEVIARVAEMLRPKLNEKGLELSISCDPRLPAVLNSDPARVRQVLTNLVNNAVKFTQEGSVRIVARPSGSPGLEDGIRFEVRDTGPGIPRALQSKLFQAFSQADASASRQSGGTGLGLAISKNLVELMGGTIGLVSEPGEGSMFWFELPRQPQTSSISRGLNLTSVVQTTIRA